MSEPVVESAVRVPDEAAFDGNSNRRGRGVFAGILLLLLFLCTATTITQSFVVHGGDQVITQVTENLECLQCHRELIPQFSMAAVHNPFMAEQCTTCHTPHGKIETRTVIEGITQTWNRTRTLVEWLPLKLVLDVFDGGGDGSGSGGGTKTTKTTEIRGEESELVLPGDQLCWMCHGDMGPMLSWEFPHSPFESGYCTTCHNPHASDYKSILAMDPRDLCVTCHPIGTELNRMQVHAPVEGRFCTNCHDPHSSRYSGILADNQRDLCFTCHPTVARLSNLGVQHHPFLYDNCTGCHEPHGSDYTPLLRAAQPSLCYECHGGIQDDFLKASHHPVGTISLVCSGCHDPHAANYQGLLPAEDNDLCYECHAAPIQASYDRSAHFQTPCWGCHTPHGSEYGPLLKDVQPELCFPCHTRTGYDDAAGGNYRNKHPVRPVYYDVNSREALTCTSSCHDPHGTPNRFMLRHYPYPRDGNCLICHGVVPGSVVGVDY